MQPIQFQIIMPCYNSAKYVRDAVCSVLAQTYPNWILIAVNDGSTDETLDILNFYRKNDSRIHVISKPNGGYCSAVNAGLDALEPVRGYVMFLGSDDLLGENLFQAIIDVSDGNVFDAVLFRCLIKENERLLGRAKETRWHPSVKETNVDLASFSEAHAEEAAILFARDTSKCFNVEIASRVRYTGKYGLDADYTYAMSVVLRANSFLAVPTDGYIWTKREDSLSAKKTDIYRESDRLNNWNLFFTNLLSMGNTPWPKPIMAFMRHCIFLSRHLLEDYPSLTREQKIIIRENIRITLRARKRFPREFPQLTLPNRVFLVCWRTWPFLYSFHRKWASKKKL